MIDLPLVIKLRETAILMKKSSSGLVVLFLSRAYKRTMVEQYMELNRWFQVLITGQKLNQHIQ